MKWTAEQQSAIDTKTGNGNILVSAAAGSGKTAVLVERVLVSIMSGETSVDRLLVVTFTEAAASEMREKIIKRLAKEVDSPGKSREEKRMLKEQLRLADTADIMTIDAFCNRVVKNNFHVLGIDPDVGIADQAMCELLRSEAVERLFDSLYKTDNIEDAERFSRLIEVYASNRNDTGLEELIIDIYKFITSFADPEKWLDEAVEVYRKPVIEMPHARYMVKASKTAAKKCLIELERFFERNDISREVSEYADELKRNAELVAAAEEWDEIYAVCDRCTNKRKKKNASVILDPIDAENEAEREAVQELMYIRDIFLSGFGNGVNISRSTLEGQCPSKRLLEETEDIVWIEKQFMKEYKRLKELRAVKEFSDIEHLTYELFRDNEEIRNSYRDKYDEILIDEYQDTNGLQDSIFELISNNNIFMVGDLKQSIYRFRGGDPYIFKGKSEIYSGEETEDARIILSQNFRSRQEILKSVNDIFACIMSENTGDVNYTGSELIVRENSRECYPEGVSGSRAEMHYLAVDKKAADKDEEEIKFVAKKISEVLRSGALVYDKDSDEYRPVRQRDIVVLESSVKANGDAIVKELEKYGIDAFTETESFFSRREIRVMLSLISVINNARQDIPLLSVMRSPIGGFSDNELARIRLAGAGCRDLISAVRLFAGGVYILKRGKFKAGKGMPKKSSAAKRRLRIKCSRFLASLDKWRGYVRSKSVAQLIWTIYEETYFYDLMGAIEQGEEAQFNLRLLYERAKSYESAGFKGLFNFIRYIDRIEGRDEDLGGAKLIGENHDVVRIMTIHKSKGLEFPYVFLIGAGREFPKNRKKKKIVYHKELKFGLPEMDYSGHYMRETKIEDYIEAQNKRENLAERMRLLYVALTRAREKLIVVASKNLKDNQEAEGLISDWKAKIVCGKMKLSEAASASCFADWMCPAALASANTWTFRLHTDFEAEQQAEEQENEYEIKADEELKKSVYAILNYRYEYPDSYLIPSRTSVTQLKELAIERGDIYEAPVYEPDSRRSSGADDIAELMFSPLHAKPAFMREKGEKPANEIGTLYHTVMSEIDLDALRRSGAECIDAELDRMENEDIISADDRIYIDTDKISGFFTSSLGERLLRSSEVHREAPFQIFISAREYDPSLGAEYEGESIILQGIIDCYFEEDGKYVLVDYKTDKVGKDGAAGIRSKYGKQLELYRQAIEQLSGRRVGEAMLYLFDTGETA